MVTEGVKLDRVMRSKGEHVGEEGIVGGRAADRPRGVEGVGRPRGQDRTLRIGRGTPVPLR